jgi:hypothetical protein
LWLTPTSANLAPIGTRRAAVSLHARSVDVLVLAVATATGLTAIDVIYVARGVIAPIYLADAVAEVGLIIAWLVALARVSNEFAASHALSSETAKRCTYV